MKDTGRCGRRHVLTTVTADVDIRVRVRGGGHTSQIYAIRQAISKSIVSLIRVRAQSSGILNTLERSARETTSFFTTLRRLT